MAFRKRNAPVVSTNSAAPERTATIAERATSHVQEQVPHPIGVRPSPADGRLTTSTGTQSLDSLLAGHAGLALGHSLLIEETGTTDYGGALMRCYAAEGIAQGHHVHVVGAGSGWIKELPALVTDRAVKHESETAKGVEDKMKIAWRYEKFGTVEERGSPDPRETELADSFAVRSDNSHPFCHTFDLTKRLELPSKLKVFHHDIGTQSNTASPFAGTLSSIASSLASEPNKVHRVVFPSLLSPLFYPSDSAQPQHLIPCLHGLRALLRRHGSTTTAMISLPLTLHPRSSATVRWCEHLLDGVVELAPFPFRPDDYATNRLSTSGAATAQEERPQGVVKVHKLPVFHERGGGGVVKGLGDDMAFTVSRKRFKIGAFSLPPQEGDAEAQKASESGGTGMPAKGEMQF